MASFNKQEIIDYVKKIPENPILTNVILLGFLSIILIGLSLPYAMSNPYMYYNNVLVEAHGMIFDLLVIGILLLWLNKNGERQHRVRTYRDEIDDFRFWKSEEAAYRTMGNIKRLNRDNVHSIDLSHSYIVNTNLNYVNLAGSNLNNGNLKDSHISGANFENSRLNQANLENTHLNNTSFRNAFLSGTKFCKASMIKTDLRKSNCMMADFENAFLMEADLEGANLMGANLKNANLYKANLKGVKGLMIEQLEMAKTLQKAVFDDEMIKKIRKDAPQLLGEEKPIK